jgi:hypothetical protein
MAGKGAFHLCLSIATLSFVHFGAKAEWADGYASCRDIGEKRGIRQGDCTSKGSAVDRDRIQAKDSTYLVIEACMT